MLGNTLLLLIGRIKRVLATVTVARSSGTVFAALDRGFQRITKLDCYQNCQKYVVRGVWSLKNK